MFCSKCGAQIQDDSVFCFKCGYKIGTGIQSQTPKPSSDDYVGAKLISRTCLSCGSSRLIKLKEGEYCCDYCGSTFETDTEQVIQKCVITEKELLDAILKSKDLQAKNETNSALRVLSDYEDKGQNNFLFLAYLGRAYRQCGFNIKAIECYEKGIKLNPEYGTLYANLGVLYLGSREYVKAIPLFEKGLQIIERNKIEYTASDYYIALANYGAAIAGAGDKKKGNKIIKQAESLGYTNGPTLRKFVGL